jgi:hypothetical protein
MIALCHSVEDCREIKKPMEQFREQQKQQPCHDGTPPRQREGKQHIAREGIDEDMEFWNTKRAIKVIYGLSNSESSDNERRK